MAQLPNERLTQSHYTTRTLSEHVGLIRKMKDKSLRDGETRQLAVALVSDAFDYTVRNGKQTAVVRAWGRTYLAPPVTRPCPSRDDMCEISRIWDFVVLNVRYVYDPKTIDTFCTVKETLRVNGGDCDDSTVVFAALLESLGFTVKARVISTLEDPENPVHIYPMVAISKDNPRKWIPLDCTVNGVRMGWEYPDIGKIWDFDL
jgi:Transglutaminase-like superfamily